MKRLPTTHGRTVLIFANAAVIMAAIAPGAATADVPSVAQTARFDCTVSGCGSNTPVLFGTPIIGLSLRGTVNAEGVVLDSTLNVPDPSQKRSAMPCPKLSAAERRRLRLGVVDGGFVGLLGSKVSCTLDDMLGMVFAMRVPVQCKDPPKDAKDPRCPDPIEVRVRIEARDPVRTWETDNQRSVPTYRLVWDKLPSPWPAGFESEKVKRNDSICPRREAWMETWQKNIKTADDEARWHRETDHLIVVHGETYNTDASIQKTGADWFNLACVGTAIAKMRLLGYDPSAVAVPPEPAANERQATLKMLTARYRGVTSFTSRGMPLMWRHRDPNRTFQGTPETTLWNRNVVESHWDAEGATCLDHRRTWSRPTPAPPGAGEPASPSVADLMTAAMHHAMPEVVVDPPPQPPLPAACRQGAVMTLACARALGAAYAAYEHTMVQATLPNLATCSNHGADHVWVTYPVNHIAHASAVF
jgi:hypothetical protein